MTTPPAEVGGVPIAPVVGATPFAVTAPPELTLDARDRSGLTSFTVTNLTGRPVRARLVPRGASGAQDSWMSLVGDSEVPMAVAATITATIKLAIPMGAPVGQHTLFLEVVAEDDTESVSGQSVSFSVPVSPQLAKKPSRLWIIGVVAVVVAVVAGVAIFLLKPGATKPAGTAPANTGRPQVSGGLMAGQELTATDGSWAGNGITFSHRWQRCTGDASTCVDVDGANEARFTPAVADIAARFRVVVIASNDGGRARAESDLVGPITPDLVEAPNLISLKYPDAQKLAIEAGLKAFSLAGRAHPTCPITWQSPTFPTKVPRGSFIRVGYSSEDGC